MDEIKPIINTINPKKIYLASPYWHSDERIRETRFKLVTRATAHFVLQGYIVFSPITHSHPISCEMDRGEHKPGGVLGHDFWLNQDMHFLNWAEELWILMLDGWEKSYGVKWETDYMYIDQKVIRYVNPDTLEFEDAP